MRQRGTDCSKVPSRMLPLHLGNIRMDLIYKTTSYVLAAISRHYANIEVIKQSNKYSMISDDSLAKIDLSMGNDPQADPNCDEVIR